MLINYNSFFLFSGHCATTTISRINDDSVADVVSQAPSLNTSERSTTYLQMPSMQNISNNHASSQNGGIQNNHVTSSKMTLINKSLSYMQNFRTLLSRQDWIFFINYIQYIHSNLDITNFDIVNKTQLPFWGFTKHITFDIVNYSILWTKRVQICSLYQGLSVPRLIIINSGSLIFILYFLYFWTF